MALEQEVPTEKLDRHMLLAGKRSHRGELLLTALVTPGVGLTVASRKGERFGQTAERLHQKVRQLRA